MFYSIVKRNSAVVRGGAHWWHDRRLKTTEEHRHSASLLKIQIMFFLKDVKLDKCLVVSSTQSWTPAYSPQTSFLAASENKTAVSGSYADVQLCVLVLVCERTLLNIRWVTCLLKKSIYCVFWWIGWVHMLLCCFQLAVTSAKSSSSQDCTVPHNNALEHCVWS